MFDVDRQCSKNVEIKLVMISLYSYKLGSELRLNVLLVPASMTTPDDSFPKRADEILRIGFAHSTSPQGPISREVKFTRVTPTATLVRLQYYKS